MTNFVNALIAGIEAGSLYVIIALGLDLIYATMNVFNFAQGDIAGYGAVAGVVLWQSEHLPVLLAFGVVLVGALIIGVLAERIAIRPALRISGGSGWVLSTLGVSVLVAGIDTLVVTRQAGSSDERTFPSYLPLANVYHLGGIFLQPSEIAIVIAMILIFVLLLLFMRGTHYGRGLRAVADDRVGAAMRGLPVARLSSLSVALGCAVAAAGGFIAGPVTEASGSNGVLLTVNGFIAATIGGVPSLGGAVIGGLLLGVVEQMTALYTNGNWTDVVDLAVLLLVLTLRPRGLFGREQRLV